MAEVRFLRKLTKSAIQNCYGCKQFRGTYCPNSKPGILRTDRIERTLPFETVVTNCAGPLYYRSKAKNDLKVYILLFSCSVSRGVHMELVSNISTTEFTKSFKRLISERENPDIIYLDNAKTFKAGAKWYNSINRD